MRNKWMNEVYYNPRNKRENIDDYVFYLLDRTQMMFKWTGLPDTIPQRMLEIYIQTCGVCCIAEVQGELYAFFGGLGGEPDVYYQPTIFTVANPALNFSKNLKIDEECVIIRNDGLMKGLIPLFRKYSSQLVENELTLHLLDVNSRTPSLISAADDRTRASAEKYQKDIEDGKPAIIAETAFFDGVRVQPYANSIHGSSVIDFIEYQQYLKSSMWQELGLDSNFNMKREALNSAETNLNKDVLLPLVDDMLKERQEACDRINKMFGLNVSVEFDSSWEDNEEELALEHDALDEESPEDNNITEEEVEDEIKVDETTEVEDKTDDTEVEVQEGDTDEGTSEVEEKLEEIEEKMDEIIEALDEEEKSEDKDDSEDETSDK